MLERYTVQPGDSLSLLAMRLIGPQASWQDLWKYNPQIIDPDVIQVGESIYYPAKEVDDSATRGGSESVVSGESFLARHGLHLAYGAGALMVLSALLLTRKK